MTKKQGNRKSLGFTELRWQCAYCNGINQGQSRFCSSCGASQEDDVAFIQPTKETLITDKARIAEIRATKPDLHCAYCEARNLATNKFCTQCGADLAEGSQREAGQVLGDTRQDEVAPVVCPACGSKNSAENTRCKNCNSSLQPQQEPEPPQQNKSNSKVGKIMIAGIGLMMLCMCVAWILASRPSESVRASVDSVRWERSIPIMSMAPVADEAWIDAVPNSAENVSCSEQYRQSQAQEDVARKSVEVCGTPYSIDQGNGFAEVVTDCEYEIYDDWCQFTTLQWQVEKVISESGSGFSAVWPDPILLGDQQLGDREQRYEIVFRSDGESYDYVTSSQAIYEDLNSAETWQLEINAFGSVTAISPAP